MSKATEVDTERVSQAKRDVIICFSWLALTPFALWFGVVNHDNFWLSAIPVLFACCAIGPLVLSWAIVSEYWDAKKGVWSAF